MVSLYFLIVLRYIYDIVDIEVVWVKEFAGKYPNLHRRSRPIEEDGPNATSMRTYLRGELETYSDKTLELYHDHLLICLDNNENLAEKNFWPWLRTQASTP